jgi:hypothetical protein
MVEDTVGDAVTSIGFPSSCLSQLVPENGFDVLVGFFSPCVECRTDEWVRRGRSGTAVTVE